MGMAASQARYLGLAARRTNCEYQGQQINQARTALANQSAELWNQMLGMTVPTVPDQTKFTKTQYAFSDGQNSFEIIDMVPSDENDEYNYTVKYRYYEDTINGMEVANTNPQVHADVKFVMADDAGAGTLKTTDAGGGTFTYTYNLGGAGEKQATLEAITDKEELQKLVKAGLITSETEPAFKITSDGKTFYQSGAIPTVAGDTPYAYSYQKVDENVSNYMLGNTSATAVTKSMIDKDVNLKAGLLKIAEDNPNSVMSAKIKAAAAAGWTDATVGEIYTYQKNGTTYFATKEEMDASRTSFAEDNGTEVSYIDRQKELKQYYTMQQKIPKEETQRALMDDATGSGRFSTIKLSNYNHSFNLQTETAINEEAYNQAMQQFYYDTQQYNQKNAEVNAKTSIIQQQDRTLELRLKQLDTEHSALQTEMEAVKKVLSKNVEETFKTFGG